MSRGSSVSVMSDYGLNYRTIEVRFPAEAKGFFLYPLSPDRFWGPTSCTMGTGDPFPGSKSRPERDADHSPPSTSEVVNEQKLYLLSPQTPTWRVTGLLYFTSIF
jgi:hypothetical protein